MKRLLFIDDNPQAQETLKMVLADDYQVISSLTGEQGLEVLEQIMAIPAPPPVVMLTDSLIRYENYFANSG